MNWNQLMSPERIRQYTKKKTSNDLRTEFEMDYHRIIASASFRRLQDKTQVFPLDKSDFIRTRLTHSLEVSSLAKSLGQNIANSIMTNRLDEEFTVQTKMDICDVLQCAGLLHDIGNPPFGHFGESAIQDWFKKNLPLLRYDGKPLTEILTRQMQEDFYHFEGNTQALRVVTKLHFLVDENGMNLTKALLGTIIKYPGSSLEIGYDKKDPECDIKRKKMGYFYADRETYQSIQYATGTNGCRHPLAFALEAADDIAYKTADIEDAVKKGCLSYGKLVGELKAVLDAVKITEFIGNGTGTGQAGGTIETYQKLFDRLERNYQKAIEKGYENPELYAVQNWVVSVQGAMLSYATEGFTKRYTEIMAGTYKKELIKETSGDLLMEVLGDIAYRYAFISKPILKLEVSADAIFDFLLVRFTEAFLYYDTTEWKNRATAVDEKMTMLISENYKRIYQTYSQDKDEVEKLYLRLLLVTDYVCGMTDSYAKRMYQELRGIE